MFPRVFLISFLPLVILFFSFSHLLLLSSVKMFQGVMLATSLLFSADTHSMWVMMGTVNIRIPKEGTERTEKNGKQ